MTTKPARSKMLHKPLGDDLGHDLIGLWTRLRPWKRNAYASASARSDGSAGVSLSAASGTRRKGNDST